MRRNPFAALLILGFVTTAGSPPAGHDRAINRLAWLEGCWMIERPRLVTEEVWLAPAGNSMMGVSRVIKSDSLVAHEVIIIRERGSRFVYEAYPSRQDTATFLSITVTDSSVVFENPTHDFPQRIGYQRIGADSLYAWIEGMVRGKIKRNEFPYTRAPHDRQLKP